MLSRRTILAAPALAVGFPARAAPAPDVADSLAALARRTGGQLGVAILDSGTGTVHGHRLDDRFPLCSTHKLLSAAFVLARVDAGQEQLGRRIIFGPDVLLFHSPITKAHVGGVGMTLAELCAAAVTVSDNAAANLLLQSFGGPEALTAHLRRHGDMVTRLDRTEPTLNESRPGDLRDTTTPRAMATLMRDVVLGPALSEESRARLQGWMVDCQTGLTKIRAGVPADWRVGDKTGSGGAPRHANNDAAVLWRPDRPPLVVTAYTIDVPGDETTRDAVLAEVGRVATA